MDNNVSFKLEKSESLKELAVALCLFQSKVGSVPKNSTNPFFKSKYANLKDTIDTVRPELVKFGLSFSQFPAGENGLISILLHNSGEYLMATAKMTPKDSSPQGQGSAITYMRRYAISAILGVDTEDDDDGNEATKPQAKASKPAVAPKPSVINSDPNDIGF
jgi:hypothetical protein